MLIVEIIESIRRILNNCFIEIYNFAIMFSIILAYIISMEYFYSYIIKIKRIKNIVISYYPKEPVLNSPFGLQNSSLESCGPSSHTPLPFEVLIP